MLVCFSRGGLCVRQHRAPETSRHCRARADPSTARGSVWRGSPSLALVGPAALWCLEEALLSGWSSVLRDGVTKASATRAVQGPDAHATPASGQRTQERQESGFLYRG